MTQVRRHFQAFAFQAHFGLKRLSACCVLVELASASGIAIPHQQLARSCGLTERSLRQRVHDLRDALRSEAIDTTPAGYALTDIGLEECRRAFEAMRADLTMEIAA